MINRKYEEIKRLEMLSVTVSLLLVCITLLFGYSKWKHSYWSSKGINVPPGYPIVGHVFKLLVGERWNFIRDSYKLFSEEKVFGLYEFFSPDLVVCDPEMVKSVLVKDFDHFGDRRQFNASEGKNSWFQEMLSVINGDKWKRLRATMSPTFSSGKMKQMFPSVRDQAKNFVTHCENVMKKSGQIDIKKSFGLFTMDVIAITAFGIECGSLLKENPIFAKKAADFFNNTPKKTLKLMLLMSVPKLCNKLGISFMDDTWDFFKQVSEETTAERRKTGNRRGDFLDLLLDEQEQQKTSFDETKDYKITDRTILAESVLFLIAGYDTTANALTASCYYISKHPECQTLLREELDSIYNADGTVDYHALMEAKYLDACINEALRLLPAIPVLERACTKEYKFEGTDITIPKGMLVEIPLWGLHRDPVYWPDPNEFKPERFLPENKANIVPFTYLPFGSGPRNCIAMRFALMEAKICLAEFVRSFEMSFAPGSGKFKLENGGGVVRLAQGSTDLKLQKIEH